jgi:hypothetical protein
MSTSTPVFTQQGVLRGGLYWYRVPAAPELRSNKKRLKKKYKKKTGWEKVSKNKYFYSFDVTA